VDTASDHVLGPNRAPITLVEYGSYACRHCRAANERISQVRDEFGARLRYVFRHRPLTGSDLARRAAEIAECARTNAQFWAAHIKLMTRSDVLTEDDLHAVASDIGITLDDSAAQREGRERVERDEHSARASGVLYTPTFFINGRRYDGPWDESSFSDAMLGSLGFRVRTAALGFASWAPSAGVLLLLATVVAIFLRNSEVGNTFERFWEQPWGFTLGAINYHMPLLAWINDALLTLFFLVVGLEIKREFTVGHLASRRSAALPIAAAIGGMVMPALLYSLIIPDGPWARGWGVPMATDTAFAVALIVMLGRRVPVELRIFLTAAAIVDDIGAITVVAIFYSGHLQVDYLLGAAALVGALALLNRSHVYRATPYIFVGILLWCCIHAGGLHATLTGVLLAMFIPTRPPANLNALMLQANSIVQEEAQQGRDVLRHGPSIPALRQLDAIHDRLESPADRMLRRMGPRSSYIVLPVFALANAGVVLSAEVLTGHEPLLLAVIVGLALGKPAGLLLASWLAVKCGLAVKPAEYSWWQLAGAGALAGIGFTMSLFIAATAFPTPDDYAAAKIAVFAASALSAIVGVFILWRAASAETTTASG